MAENSYTPPEQLQDTDVDVIHARMLADLPINIDQTKGGFAYDMTRPSAMEKSYAIEAMNVIVQMIFPEWASGYVLDMHAARNSLSRKEAVPAKGYLHLVGTTNVYIEKGHIFCTPATAINANVEYESTESVTLEYDEDTETFIANVPIQAVVPGKSGNTPMDTIVLSKVSLQGITECTNPVALTDGADEESDDELRVRVMEAERNRQVSYIGNDNDYIRWAKQVDGVGSAAVIREWQGYGTGTVKVVILSQNGQSASEQLKQAVYDYIMGTDDDPQTRLAPIGAILTVSTGIPMTMNFTANIELEEGFTLDTVEAGFRERLLAYFPQAKADGEVMYHKLAWCLSETPGVKDWRQLLVNNSRDNLTVGIEDLPAITSMTLTEAEV